MHRRVRHIFLMATLAAFAGSALLQAQSITGAITGSITDPSGAAVPSAKVTATEVSSNIASETQSDVRGSYSFPSLRPGVYRIEVEATGFRKLVNPSIEVRVNDRLEINLTMVLGAISESVEVNAAPPLVESQTGAIGNVIENKKIINLPLNTRNPFQLALLSPGVVPSTAFGNAFNTSADFIINGNPSNTSEILIDGITNSVPAANPIVVVSLFPSPDALEEFKVQTNGYAAEFGRSGGGIVNMVIKSGGNQFHGVLYEFLRNSQFDANDFFSNSAGRTLSSFKRNQYGFTAGGPIMKDKAFFFFNYEALRQRARDQLTGTVPTALERRGDFSQSRQLVGSTCSPLQIFDPSTTRANPAGGFLRDPFPNNVIPTNRLDKVGANVATYFPNPTSAGAACTGINNFLSNKSNPTDTNEIDMKFDWAPSSRNKLTAGLGWRTSTATPPNHYGNVANTAVTSDNMPARSGRLEYNRTQTPTLLMQARFGITRLERYYGAPAPADFTLSGSLGFPASLEQQMTRPIGFPVFSFAGYPRHGKRQPVSRSARQHRTPGTAISPRSAGRHQIKAGIEYRDQPVARRRRDRYIRQFCIRPHLHARSESDRSGSGSRQRHRQPVARALTTSGQAAFCPRCSLRILIWRCIFKTISACLRNSPSTSGCAGTWKKAAPSGSNSSAISISARPAPSRSRSGIPRSAWRPEVRGRGRQSRPPVQYRLEQSRSALQLRLLG